MQLSAICQIQTGYTARGRIVAAEEGGVRAIQLRDIPVDGAIDPTRLGRVRVEDAHPRHFAGPGDVLFRSRGEKSTASALPDAMAEPALVILPLVILRPHRDAILPDYLAWFLNQAAAQRHFSLAAQGTSLRMVPRAALDDLEIDVPPLAIQRAVVSVIKLGTHEQHLATCIAEKRRRWLDLTLADKAARLSRHSAEGRRV